MGKKNNVYYLQGKKYEEKRPKVLVRPLPVNEYAQDLVESRRDEHGGFWQNGRQDAQRRTE